MSDLALQRIRENIEKHKSGEDASVLDLGNCGLTEVPEEIIYLIWLEYLSLSDFAWNIPDKEKNKISKLNFVGKLTNLQHLNCSGTNVKNLTPLKELVNFYAQLTAHIHRLVTYRHCLN